MPLIIPHYPKGQAERHASVAYLWRARCSCGFYVLGASADAASAGLSEHISAEEPFPEILPAEPGSEAWKREQES